MADNLTEQDVINTILLHGGKCTSEQIDDFLYSSTEIGQYFNLLRMLNKMELAGTLESQDGKSEYFRYYSIVEMGNNGP